MVDDIELKEMERVSFITTESGKDLIVSFAIEASDFGEVKSLTLLRTPKYEFLLDEAERGVNVSHEDFLGDEDDYLEEIELSRTVVRITTSHRRYTLDVRSVDDGEIREVEKILKKMNLDNRFTLSMV